MDTESKRELYIKIKNARESVAGSDVQPYKECIKRLKEAQDIAMKIFGESRLKEVCLIALNLVHIENDLSMADLRHSSYEARLEPDQKLCDILNGSYFENVR